MNAVYPSGRQFDIECWPYRASITEVGGGLRSLAFGSLHIIDGFDRRSPVTGSRGQILAPWPNRLYRGKWNWNNAELQLPVDDPVGENASHGLVRRSAWIADIAKSDRVRLRHRLKPQPGFPFTLDFSVTYSVSLSGLTVELEATNPTSIATPVALGMHPYLRPLGQSPIDECMLSVPAQHRLLTDAGGRPTTLEPVNGTAYDFREPHMLGALSIDSAFANLDSGENRRVVTTVTDAAGEVRMWADPSTKYIQIFTGDTLSPGARRRGIAIEPMTAPANALASGLDLAVLERGESLGLRWGLSAHPASEDTASSMSHI